MKTGKKQTDSVQLDSLLRRGDIWRGDSKRFVNQMTLDTGYDKLNGALLHKGWPVGTLLEVCQPRSKGYSEWMLLTPALCVAPPGYLTLLNPPALPFAQGLIQSGLDLDRVLVVQSSDRASFLKSFAELARTKSCSVLLAWQSNLKLSYTDLRKCLLASANNNSMNVIFRSNKSLLHNSPADTRILLSLADESLEIKIVKQKGLLKRHLSVEIPLPDCWVTTKVEKKPEVDEIQGDSRVASVTSINKKR